MPGPRVTMATSQFSNEEIFQNQGANFFSPFWNVLWEPEHEGDVEPPPHDSTPVNPFNAPQAPPPAAYDLKSALKSVDTPTQMAPSSFSAQETLIAKLGDTMQSQHARLGSMSKHDKNGSSSSGSSNQQQFPPQGRYCPPLRDVLESDMAMSNVADWQQSPAQPMGLVEQLQFASQQQENDKGINIKNLDKINETLETFQKLLADPEMFELVKKLNEERVAARSKKADEAGLGAENVSLRNQNQNKRLRAEFEESSSEGTQGYVVKNDGTLPGSPTNQHLAPIEEETYSTFGFNLQLQSPSPSAPRPAVARSDPMANTMLNASKPDNAGIDEDNDDNDNNAPNPNKRRRRKKTTSQMEILRNTFLMDPKPEKNVLLHISKQTNLTYQEVSRWFRNERHKFKKYKSGLDKKSGGVASSSGSGGANPPAHFARQQQSESLRKLEQLQTSLREQVSASLANSVRALRMRAAKQAVQQALRAGPSFDPEALGWV